MTISCQFHDDFKDETGLKIKFRKLRKRTEKNVKKKCKNKSCNTLNKTIPNRLNVMFRFTRHTDNESEDGR